MLVSATVPEDNAGGSSWDALGGLPDPKVTLRANDGPTSFQESSESQSDTLTPSWSAVLLENITWRALSMTIGVEVSDADPLGDDFMGSCWEAPTEGNADGGSFTIRCARDTGATPPQTGVSVTLRLRAH